MKGLERVLAVLKERGTPVALVGAGAMAVHGIVRSTLDVDLLTTDAACLSREYWQSDSFTDSLADIQVGPADDPLAGVVRFRPQGEPHLDLIVGKATWQAEILARAEGATFAGVSLPVAGRADLILLKLYAGGPQDAWDIEQLLDLGDRAAIREAVVAALDRLPARCRRLWERVAGTSSTGS